MIDAMDREQRVTYWEEANCLGNVACWAIELQVNRLECNEPEISEFVLQQVVDFHFLVTAIARLRKAADLACRASDISDQIKAFDDAVPDWRQMRNALEHVDEYWQNKGQNKAIQSADLATISFGPVIEWIGLELNLRETLTAAHTLFRAINGIWPLSDKKG